MSKNKSPVEILNMVKASELKLDLDLDDTQVEKLAAIITKFSYLYLCNAVGFYHKEDKYKCIHNVVVTEASKKEKHIVDLKQFINGFRISK